MNEIPTPRTDAKWESLQANMWTSRALEVRDFARTLERELSRLRAENAAMREAIAQQVQINKEVNKFPIGNFYLPETVESYLGFPLTPPVCVPVDVVAKLGGALELFGEHYADCHGVIAHGEQCNCGLAASIALAAPFLAKGERKV